jgi:hypothetical protein
VSELEKLLEEGRKILYDEEVRRLADEEAKEREQRARRKSAWDALHSVVENELPAWAVEHVRFGDEDDEYDMPGKYEHFCTISIPGLSTIYCHLSRYANKPWSVVDYSIQKWVKTTGYEQDVVQGSMTNGSRDLSPRLLAMAEAWEVKRQSLEAEAAAFNEQRQKEDEDWEAEQRAVIEAKAKAREAKPKPMPRSEQLLEGAYDLMDRGKTYGGIDAIACGQLATAQAIAALVEHLRESTNAYNQLMVSAETMPYQY